MRESGALDEMVGAVRHILVDNRFTMGLLPSLIGLLPMPGGALFSAPMIDGLSDEAEISAEFRTYINYWFRHVWEYAFPLYPGLLLAVAILKVDLVIYITYQFPLCLAAILGGAVFGLMKIPRKFHPRANGSEARKHFISFIHGFWPVLLIIVTVVVVPAIVGYMGNDSLQEKVGEANLLMIMLPLTVLLFGIPRLGGSGFVRCIRKAFNYKLLGTLLSVLIFKEIIGASGAVEELPDIFESMHIPGATLLILLPMLIGYLTGLTHTYASVTFPLLLPFMGDPVDISKAQLAFAFGFIGVLLSPVHLCMVLSVDYYKSELPKVVRMLIAPCSVIALVSLLLYFLR